MCVCVCMCGGGGVMWGVCVRVCEFMWGVCEWERERERCVWVCEVWVTLLGSNVVSLTCCIQSSRSSISLLTIIFNFQTQLYPSFFLPPLYCYLILTPFYLFQQASCFRPKIKNTFGDHWISFCVTTNKKNEAKKHDNHVSSSSSNGFCQINKD